MSSDGGLNDELMTSIRVELRLTRAGPSVMGKVGHELDMGWEGFKWTSSRATYTADTEGLARKMARLYLGPFRCQI